MIKIVKKKSKYNYEKTPFETFADCLKTVSISIIIAFLITLGLSIHARNEMIKNISSYSQNKSTADKEIAKQIISSNTNLMSDMQHKTYSVCLNIGKLFELAGDYPSAQMAYTFALEKASPTNLKIRYKLFCVLVEQEKFDEALDLLNSVDDSEDVDLFKFKTRSNIVIGDKYYSIGKFLTAAKFYEKAEFYYDKFSRKDKVVERSIKERIINSYIQAADEIVKAGHNSEAVRFLKKVEKKVPNNLSIKYKLAVVLSDSDPEEAVLYLEDLLNKIPQHVDYNIYGRTLLKAANIADLDNRPIEAKRYRYKIHSIDLYLARKVLYKNDIDVLLDKFSVKKVFFTYPINLSLKFINNSSVDLTNLQGDFLLMKNDKEIEKLTKKLADKRNVILADGGESKRINLKFKKHLFTKKEMQKYTVKIYLYKDEKFKTLVSEFNLSVK